MPEKTHYAINTQVKYPSSTRFDIQDVIGENAEKWFNQTLVKINDSVLRLGVLEGEFHFHKHDEDDELFFVMEGELLIDVGDETVPLSAGQGYVVPKGVVHRTRAPSRVIVLMMASADVVPIGD